MGRWEPNARGRLEQAAMELYVERGFDSTTVAEIAERAGLTERTFFRHFADKREVLFGGSSVLVDILSRTIADAPDELAPVEVVAQALDAVALLMQERGERARQRQAIIAAHTELRERELIKLASLASAIAVGLRRRGVKDPDATLVAEAGIAALRVGFETWVRQPSKKNLPRLIRGSLDQLHTVTAR